VRRHVVQKDCVTLCGAEKPRDARVCRETARRHVVQKDRATLRFAEGPRTSRCARHYSVQRNHAMPRGAETARRHVIQRDRSTPPTQRDQICTTHRMDDA